MTSNCIIAQEEKYFIGHLLIIGFNYLKVIPDNHRNELKYLQWLLLCNFFVVGLCQNFVFHNCYVSKVCVIWLTILVQTDAAEYRAFKIKRTAGPLAIRRLHIIPIVRVFYNSCKIFELFKHLSIHSKDLLWRLTLCSLLYFVTKSG